MRDHYVIILKHICATGSEHQKSKSNRPSNTVLWQETWEIVYYSPFRISTREKKKEKSNATKISQIIIQFFCKLGSFVHGWLEKLRSPCPYCNHPCQLFRLLLKYCSIFFSFSVYARQIRDHTLTSNPWYVILVRTMVTQISNQMSSQSDNAAANAGGANSSSNRYV